MWTISCQAGKDLANENLLPVTSIALQEWPFHAMAFTAQCTAAWHLLRSCTQVAANSSGHHVHHAVTTARQASDVHARSAEMLATLTCYGRTARAPQHSS